MSFSITQETPLQDDVRALVAALNAHLNPLSPPEFQFQMTVEQMAEPDTHLFVVRDKDDTAVGMGALKVHDNGLGELKRMYTLPEMRGKRLGRMLVDAIEARALEMGLTQLKLETGSASVDEMAGAHRLYTRCGYTPCGAFLDYPESAHSAFYEKALVGDASM